MDLPARIEPGPGQESVWDYPRPPRLETSVEHLVVELAGVVVADTRRGLRVLETSQPPAYYFPPEDVATGLLRPTTTRTFCEWKGQARYHTIVVGDREAPDAAWSYDRPVDAFSALAGHYAFYPSRVDRCTVDGEMASPNEGTFYGGWVTSRIVGPFKGGPGSATW
jgi:uncharacterized protein (DUF427 family)